MFVLSVIPNTEPLAWVEAIDCSELAVSERSVPLVGKVRAVVPVVVSATSLPAVVEKAPPKEMVLPSGIVSVPVVSVTVRPATFSALNACGTAVNRTRGDISTSPLNTTPR